MDAGEFTLPPVSVEVLGLEDVPWLHSLVVPSGTHCDPLILDLAFFRDDCCACLSLHGLHWIWFLDDFFLDDFCSSVLPNLKSTEVEVLAWYSLNLQEGSMAFAAN